MINSKIIEQAVYDLCLQANTKLPEDIYQKLLEAYKNEINKDAKEALALILNNAQMAYNKKMPLCQDTGQVLVFINGKGEYLFDSIYKSINKGIEKAYQKNFFRKSIVKNALFERINTKTNTPSIIYTEIADLNGIEIDILIKGAGCENVSQTRMLSPTATEEEIIDYIVSTIKKAGSKGCPPYFLGIGIGGTMENAGILSKKSFLLEKNIDEKHEKLAQKIKEKVNQLNIGAAGLGGASTALDVKILTDFTHIACMPVAVTVNCHSTRHAKCFISKNGDIKNFSSSIPKFMNFSKSEFIKSSTKVNSSDITKLKTLKNNQNILLSGEIYTARDMAHKRLTKMIEKGEELPFDIKDKIIFYAGPCPCQEPCIIGSIGPTTASRMDKFTPVLYKNGILATIGKGERSQEVKDSIKQNEGIYFTIIGGIACYLSEKFVKKELIAFEDLGTEAIYRFEVEELPLRVNFC